jgi:hypothetical protein
MANKHRGGVDVELDGETHQLHYTLNSLAEIEERLGLNSIGEILDTLKALSMRTLRTLLWAGLIHEDASLTEHQVGEMDFDFAATVGQVSEAIGNVFKSPEVDVEDTPAGNVHRPARGAGRKR